MGSLRWVHDDEQARCDLSLRVALTDGCNPVTDLKIAQRCRTAAADETSLIIYQDCLRHAIASLNGKRLTLNFLHRAGSGWGNPRVEAAGSQNPPWQRRDKTAITPRRFTKEKPW